MDQRVNVDRQTGPENSVAHLREQQGQLRHTDVSWDLSEVSYQTEQTDFRHTRHSSLNAEPLTLDAEQIHDAKYEYTLLSMTALPSSTVKTTYPDWRSKIFAWNLQVGALGNERVDVLQTTDPEAAVSILTKGLQNFDVQIGDGTPKDGEAEILAQQPNTLVEKTQQLVGTSEKQAGATGISTESSGVKPQVMDKKREVCQSSITISKDFASLMMMRSSSSLPDHLVESVLARLPVRSFFSFRTVCRSWNTLLFSPTFLSAYSESAIRHNVWFLVVTTNLGRLGHYGHKILSTYDPEHNDSLRIPLPSPLCDLNPCPTAADGGLVCYFVYENRLRTLFVCNPLTKSVRKLPLVHKTSSHISVLKMVMEDRQNSGYKVFVAGMVPSENGGDSLSMEVYDSATDSWSNSGIIPAKYPKRRPVYCNGILYVRCYDQRSLLLTYDVKARVWNRIHAPLPHTLGYEELVHYQGHIFLVGVLEENYRIESVCMWEFQRSNRLWKPVGSMPRDLFNEFFCDREYFECQEDERVLMKCCRYGDLILCVAFNISHRGPFKMLAYDLPQKSWRRLPESFRARECITHKFIDGIIYEPRLDVIA